MRKDLELRGQLEQLKSELAPLEKKYLKLVEQSSKHKDMMVWGGGHYLTVVSPSLLAPSSFLLSPTKLLLFLHCLPYSHPLPPFLSPSPPSFSRSLPSPSPPLSPHPPSLSRIILDVSPVWFPLLSGVLGV